MIMSKIVGMLFFECPLKRLFKLVKLVIKLRKFEKFPKSYNQFDEFKQTFNFKYSNSDRFKQSFKFNKWQYVKTPISTFWRLFERIKIKVKKGFPRHKLAKISQ